MTSKQISRLMTLINYRFVYLLSLDNPTDGQNEEFKELTECFLALIASLNKE